MSHNTWNRAKQQQQRPVKMKCIVLGSAGAGKTSFLRKYFTGKFEPQYRKSTIGADFYSTIIRNPWFVKNEGLNQYHSIGRIEENKEGTTATIQSDHHGTVKKSKRKDEKKVKKKKKSKKKKHKHKTEETSNKTNDTNPSNASIITAESSVYTNSTDNSNQSFPLTSVPAHMNIPNENYLAQSPQISIQMWDTAGKERLVSESTGMTSRLGDSFFRHAQAAVLIYDATSSRSFLQLMKWYSDLLDRIKKVNHEYNDVYYDENHNQNSNGGPRNGFNSTSFSLDDNCTKPSVPKQKFPVLIVGTKLDRVRAELSKQARKKIVPQRDVLGLKNKTFKGQDYHYEYTVRSDDHESNKETKYNVFNADIPLSYGLEGGSTWTADHEYQDCLRVVEDGCFPDRYMVLLWCKRNGLKHVEISSLDGTGVNDAVSSVVELVLESLSEKNIDPHPTDQDDRRRRRDPIIDFQERYGQNENNSCCNWICNK